MSMFLAIVPDTANAANGQVVPFVSGVTGATAVVRPGVGASATASRLRSS